MKKIFIAILVISFLCIAGVIAFISHTINNPRDISIRVSESDDTYRLYASYNSYKAGRIHRYLRDQLHNDLFKKNRVDAFLTLDDQTRVRIKTTPGKLLILLNKKENDFDSYFRIKQLGDGIKYRLSHD
ncbi:MAG: hypothetical protein V4450_17130 [Bacteroidota bacterium]